MKTEPTRKQRIAAWMQLEAERAVAAKVTARLKAAPAPLRPADPTMSANYGFVKPRFSGRNDFGVIKIGCTT